jgi:hypothetical protein
LVIGNPLVYGLKGACGAFSERIDRLALGRVQNAVFAREKRAG